MIGEMLLLLLILKYSQFSRLQSINVHIHTPAHILKGLKTSPLDHFSVLRYCPELSQVKKYFRGCEKWSERLSKLECESVEEVDKYGRKLNSFLSILKNFTVASKNLDSMGIRQEIVFIDDFAPPGKVARVNASGSRSGKSQILRYVFL